MAIIEYKMLSSVCRVVGSTEDFPKYHFVNYNTCEEHYKCSCLDFQYRGSQKNEMCKHIQEVKYLDDAITLNNPNILEVQYFTSADDLHPDVCESTDSTEH